VTTVERFGPCLPPRLHAPVLDRPRLVRRLDEGLEGQVTRVIAPVGSGKSTLVARWASVHDARWLRTDQHGRLLEQVQDVQGLFAGESDEDSAIGKLRDLGSGGSRAVVVVDAAQGLSDDVARLVTRLVADAPRAANLVLVAPDEGVLPDLGPGVATTTLRGSDLRFTDDEARSLVRLLVPRVDQAELEGAVQDARGWALALEVGARAAGLGHADAPESVAAGPADRLLRALSSAPPQLGGLLLSTCDEEVFDAPTAAALSGDSEAARLVERMALDGLLLEAEDGGPGGRTVFRLNPVLRRTLRHLARDGSAYDARVAAHRRAAAALSRQGGDPAVVFRHAMLARDEQTLLDALRTKGHLLLVPRHQQLLERVLDALPGELRSAHPSVLVLESMLCRLQLRYDEAAELSSAADRMAGGQDGPDAEDELTRDFRALMLLWRSRCGWAEPQVAMTTARERLGCQHVETAAHRVAPGQSLVWSTWLMGELATVEVRTGELDSAGLHLQELIHHARARGQHRMLAAGLAHRSVLEMIDGSFQTAGSTARSSLDQLTDGVQDLPYVALAHLVAGWSALHELDLAECEKHLVAAEGEAAVGIDDLVVELARLLRAKLLAEQGLVEDARRLLAQHRPVHERLPRFMLRLTAITEAHTAALVNDRTMVANQTVRLAELGCRTDAELFGALGDVGKGDVEHALKRVEAVLAEPGLDAVTGAGGAALKVALLLMLGHQSCAAASLPDLLTQVFPQRLLQIFTIGFLSGEPFARLLVDEAERADGHPYAAAVLEALNGYVAKQGLASPRARAGSEALITVQAAPDAPAPGTTAAIRLTRRERDVLTELSMGGSYGDVARALFVSENTVKTHLASVYRKLGVERRGDALRAAREAGLL
jgi:ATP/maltotriose-dependent transcriptional regulator MalT